MKTKEEIQETLQNAREEGHKACLAGDKEEAMNLAAVVATLEYVLGEEHAD